MNHRWIALLRGINVGGKNKLPMADLTRLFEAAGCTAITTYIQSGNVVFTAPMALGNKMADIAADAIASELGLEIPVVIRKAKDWQRAIERNPFAKSATDPKHLHMAALQSRPSAARSRSLDADRSPGDQFVVLGSEVYLHCPNGVARTKLTNAWFDSQLETVSTMRNWNTCLRLLALAQAT